MIGRALGAGDAGVVRVLGDRMLQWGLWGGVMSGAAILVTSTVLPNVFSDDPAVVSLAAFLLIHVAVNQPVNGIAFVLDGILIGAGDLRFLARATAIASLTLTAAALTVLWTGSGIGWLWGSLAVWMLLRVGLLGRRYRSDAWLITGAVR